MNESYHEKQKQINTLKLRELERDLPKLATEFFRGIADITAARTKIAYAYDLKIFFDYLIKEDVVKKETIKEINAEDLEKLTIDELEEFVAYLSFYTKIDDNYKEGYIEYQNDEKGKARKISTVRSLFKYLYKKRKIVNNPAALLDVPKLHQKNIVYLDVNEIVELLDEVENGEKLTEGQQRFHSHTKLRDLAIVTLLLGTGMRVSECVGIDIDDVDFDNNGVKITRKGGNEVIVYFGEEVAHALMNYLNERKNSKCDDTALFLSLQNKRIGVRAVQNLVKKYSTVSVKLKNISPHKLRSTYGTNLYRESGDIYLVADVLGHKDINTTKKHYAQIEDAHRRSAAKYINLRKE